MTKSNCRNNWFRMWSQSLVGSYQEAQQSKYAKIWEVTRSAESEGLIRAGTFTLAVKVPVGCNVIDARWVFKWKANETGKIAKAKARLIAKGFKQKYGVDYLETFSPTVNAASQRLSVALACTYNLESLHWDIEQAFVQSELDHEVHEVASWLRFDVRKGCPFEQEFEQIEAGIQNILQEASVGPEDDWFRAVYV